ncbi:MAG: amidase [Acidimicrobiales bacterium]
MADAPLDGLALAELVERGEVSPLELVDAAIARVEAVNPQLNAVIHERFDKARAEAAAADLPDGPFKGVPFLVKDLGCATEGDPYNAGAEFLKRAGWHAEHDSFIAQAFKAAGLVILGRTNTPELGAVPTTEPLAFGPTRNPWDVARTPGGSSGGSAAAVAAGVTPLAHATDGGGSIRVPASSCGLVGLKPSRGRVSLGPDAGEIWSGLVTELVVSRSVRDTAAALDAVSAPVAGDPYVAPAPSRAYLEEVVDKPGRLRVGYCASVPGLRVDEECQAAAESTARLLAVVGHRVEPASPPPLRLEFEEFARRFGRVVMASVAAEAAAWEATLGRPIQESVLEPAGWRMVQRGRRITAVQHLENLAWLAAYSRRMAAFWARGFDLVITPTAHVPPPGLGWFTDTPEGRRRTQDFCAFTAPFNVTGQPAISLPLHWTEPEDDIPALPVGVQLVAAYGREDHLLAVAAQLEAARPWADKLPPLFAA